MGLMDSMMDGMIKSMSKEKKEQMMTDMMPLMMQGLDINELMPKIMEEMLKDVTVDDVINTLKKTLSEHEKFVELFDKLKQANLMQQMMFKTYKSKLNFDETVTALEKSAPENGWHIPDIRDLQEEYHNAGLKDMTKLKILYFCNSTGGYAIIQNDQNKAMSVMMPTGVAVYETSEGNVEIGAMNFGMMSGMFAGTIGEVLNEGGENLEKSLEGIVVEL